MTHGCNAHGYWLAALPNVELDYSFRQKGPSLDLTPQDPDFSFPKSGAGRYVLLKCELCISQGLLCLITVGQWNIHAVGSHGDAGHPRALNRRKGAGVCEALPELLGTAAHRDESVPERADITTVASSSVENTSARWALFVRLPA